MIKIALVILCIVLTFSTSAFAKIWVSDEELNNFVRKTEKDIGQLVSGGFGEPVKGLKLYATISKESYEKGEVIELKYVVENLSDESKYYRSGEDDLSFVAISDGFNVLIHKPTFVCEKSLGMVELKPHEKLEWKMLINTERFWQKYYADEKWNVLPTYFQNKRITVAMYLCKEGFAADKTGDAKIPIKSNLLQFEILDK